MKNLYQLISWSFVSFVVIFGALCGFGFFDKNQTQYQQIIDQCEATGGHMQTEPRLVIREIDGNQVEVKINTKVCKAPTE